MVPGRSPVNRSHQYFLEKLFKPLECNSVRIMYAFPLIANIIDVLGFFRVINYSVPETSETYTLRTGHKPLPLQWSLLLRFRHKQVFPTR